MPPLRKHHVTIEEAGTVSGRAGRTLFAAAVSIVLGIAATAVGGPAYAAPVAPGTVSPAAVVSPDSVGPKCTFGSSNGNTKTCITINGSGQHVNYILGSASVIHSRILQLKITGPKGTLFQTPFIAVPDNSTMTAQWSPNATEPVGSYCVITIRLSSDNSQTQIGKICADVLR